VGLSRLCTLDHHLTYHRRYAKKAISDLLQNRVDIWQLVITKALSKTGGNIYISTDRSADNFPIEYTGKQAHVELVKRMRQRDPGQSHPSQTFYLAILNTHRLCTFNRRSYCLYHSQGHQRFTDIISHTIYSLQTISQGSPLYARAEDPIYALENNIPIDTKYYLENQLSKPLTRIFEPILGEKATSIREYHFKI
jgi:DNA polymerase delta subunit 1